MVLKGTTGTLYIDSMKVKVYYTPNDYTITASPAGGGNISPAGDTEVAPNGSQAYDITPGPNHIVSDVVIDGTNHLGVTDPQKTINSTSTVTDNAWHHVALVHDGGYLYMYVDGQSDATPVATGITPIVNADPAIIGDWKTQSLYFAGLIDDVRIYSRALTSQEIQDHFNASSDQSTGLNPGYAESFTYNSIGNMMSKNGTSYAYPSAGNPRPHAVTGVGSYTLGYDANGNMTSRTRYNPPSFRYFTWDVENHLSQVLLGEIPIGTYVYDGNGQRIKKTEGGSTTIYVNRYYEKDITGGVETSHYYLGGTQVAIKKGSTLEYLHQDHLGSSSLSTDSSGDQVSAMKVFSFGETRSSTGTLGTDKKYTGQRLDGTGLYFYNARYYDEGLGRFISPDSIVPNPANPQSLNRYSHVLNNPLRYADPMGLFEKEELNQAGIYEDDISPEVWQMLRDANVGDRLELVTPTGTGALVTVSHFSFYHEEDEDGNATLKLLQEEGRFTGISSVVTVLDPGTSIRREEWNDNVRAYQYAPTRTPVSGGNAVVGTLYMAGGTLEFVGGVGYALAGILTYSLAGQVNVQFAISVGMTGYSMFDYGLRMVTNGRYSLPITPYPNWPMP